MLVTWELYKLLYIFKNSIDELKKYFPIGCIIDNANYKLNCKPKHGSFFIIDYAKFKSFRLNDGHTYLKDLQNPS